jgi:hypothetical protein
MVALGLGIARTIAHCHADAPPGTVAVKIRIPPRKCIHRGIGLSLYGRYHAVTEVEKPNAASAPR